LPPIEHGPDDLVRKAQQGGGIRFKGRDIRVSSASVRQPIALRPSLETDGMSRLYFATIISDSLVLKELDVL
jgi:hypothetical protein